MRPVRSNSITGQRRVTAAIKRRRGATLVLITLLIVPMFALVALALDYGYLLKIKSDLQRCADAAALACVQNLVPAADGTQDLNAVRAALRDYATKNSEQTFQVLDADIEIGRYDPATIYSNLTILNSGVYDTVRVTVRRDASANSRVGLFIGPLLGMQDAAVTATATAVLQKGAVLPPGAKILPFSVPQIVWDDRAVGDEWSIYGDGKIADDAGNSIPGNWGTLDIGHESNSTADLNDQILNGLRQSDLDALHDDGRIPTNAYIDATGSASVMQADTGLSTGLKQSVQAIHGEFRIVPIYDTSTGVPGNNLEYHVVKWGVVKVIDSNWNGAKNTYVTIEKSYDFQGELRPNSDLSNTGGSIEGAFTSPVLVE